MSRVTRLLLGQPDPELAAVGLSEQQARDAGIDVKTVSYGVGSVAGGALLGKDVGGKAQLVIDQSERVVVGATFVGPNYPGSTMATYMFRRERL